MAHPEIVYVPAQIVWAFTADRGWHLVDTHLTALDMDRLAELADLNEKELAR